MRFLDSRFNSVKSFLTVGLVGTLVSLFAGCRASTSPIYTGHFYLSSQEVDTDLTLAEGGNMQETIRPKHGAAQSISGQWHIKNNEVVIEPYLDYENGEIRSMSSWSLSAQLDQQGDLMALSYGNRGLIFSRVHPLTMAELHGEQLELN